MRLNDLSLPVLHAVALVLYLLCLTAVFCALQAFRQPSAKTVFGYSLVTGALNFTIASPLTMYLNRVQNNRPVEAFIQRMLLLPVGAVALLAAASLAAIVLLYLRLRRLRQKTLTTQSLCEGLDQLTDGACYSLPDGFPKLVNNQMQYISNTAFGESVVDALHLQEKLENEEVQPGCRVEEDEGNTFLVLPDESAWRLKQQTITVEGNPMTETIAYHATARYRAMLELRARNARLEETNRQLNAYLSEIDAVVREKEILEAKIRLHNKLGQCLLVLRSYLTGLEPDRRTVDEQLQHTVSLLQNTQTDAGSGDKLQAVLKAASVIGVEIRIRGTVPAPLQTVFAEAVHECLTNTVKHAHGRLLEAEITQDGAATNITLQNDGQPPKGPVQESGGLCNLRTAVERLGGTMGIESSPVFRLHLQFDRTGNNTKQHSVGGEKA